MSSRILLVPYIGAQSGLPSEISEDLELGPLLQAAVEMVANQQFVHARRLLSVCDSSACKSRNPVQGIAYYFAEAFNERIDLSVGNQFIQKPRRAATDDNGQESGSN